MGIVKKTVMVGTLVLAGVLVIRAVVEAHCQIPCGIYDDDARLAEITEHVTTIEKSMSEITKLSTEHKTNYNQIVRWVQNKEAHADELGRIVTRYFMTQRVKPADPGDEKAYQAYLTQLTILHRMLVAAMKAKQTTDISHVETLKELAGEFKKAYPGFSHRH